MDCQVDSKCFHPLCICTAAQSGVSAFSAVWSQSGDPAGGRRSDYNNYTSSDRANTHLPVLTNLNQIISCDRGHCRAQQIDSARRLIYFDNTIGLAENLGYNLIIAGACQRYKGTGAARRSAVTSGLD